MHRVCICCGQIGGLRASEDCASFPDVADRGQRSSSSDEGDVHMKLLDHLNRPGLHNDWIKAHRDYDGDWCLIWPFGRDSNGYGQTGTRPSVLAHRLMCACRHGEPSSPDLQAAHSCHRGPFGCVNPKHLSWKTNQENQLERYQASGPTKRHKLTAEQAAVIRTLTGIETTRDTARRFRISRRNVELIQAGLTWRPERPLPRRFTEEEVRSIRERYRNVPATHIAKEYGVTTTIINRIQWRTTYKWVEDAAVTKRGVFVPRHSHGPE